MNKMSFNDLIEKIGFSKAVVFFQKKLSQKFWDKLTYDEWRKIFWETSSDDNSELKQTSLNKMSELAVDFYQWLDVYGLAYSCAGKENELTNLALLKMSELATHFKQWKKIYGISSIGSDMEKIAYAKLIELESTLPTPDAVLKLADDLVSRGELDGSHWSLCYHSKEVYIRMAMLETPFAQWREMYSYIYILQNERVKAILNRMSELAENFQQWFEIYSLTVGRENLKEINKSAEDRLQELAISSEELLSVYSVFRFSSQKQPRKTIVEKIIQRQETFEDWQAVFWEADKNQGDELRITALIQMSELATTFNEWDMVYYHSPADSELKKMAQRKIIETASTFDDWKTIHKYDFGSELKEMAFKKMSELVSVD